MEHQLLPLSWIFLKEDGYLSPFHYRKHHYWAPDRIHMWHGLCTSQWILVVSRTFSLSQKETWYPSLFSSPYPYSKQSLISLSLSVCIFWIFHMNKNMKSLLCLASFTWHKVFETGVLDSGPRLLRFHMPGPATHPLKAK
jgi:hypothetical protein